MRKRSISIVISGLIVISGILGFFTFESEVVSAGITIYVGSGPGNSTTSIQDAIDNFANPGDTVFVYNGTYYENVVINKTINLTGENRDTTIIDGGGSGVVVRIERNLVNVTGFTITNGSTGIEIPAGTNYTVIEHNNVTLNNLYGIILGNSSNHNIIKNNIIYSNGHSGIYLNESSQNEINGNYISNHGYDGINLTSSSNYNDVKNNNITMSLQDGIHLESNSNYNDISNNNVSNNIDGIYLVSVSNNNITNNNIYLNNDDGINLYMDSNYNNILNNDVYQNNDDGIYLYTSSNNTITGNDIWNNTDGMYIYLSSDDNLISDNNVSLHDNFFSSGIYFRWTSNNTITNNNVTDNNNGIYFRDSSYGNMINNNASNNFYGIYLRDSSYCNITGNEASNNFWGIFIRGGDGNNVTNNNVSNSEFGIRVRASTYNNISNNDLYSNTEAGIYITSDFSRDSTHNIVMGNNISDTNDGIAIFPSFGRRPYQNYIIGNIISNAQIGIHLYYVPTNTILNNTMFYCGIVIEGDQLSYWNAHHIDTDNTVNGKPVHYLKNQTGGIIPPNAGEAILANCTNSLVLIQELTEGSVGIELGFSSNSLITQNNISSNKWAGIYSWNSDESEIIDNTISSNTQYGILLQSSSDFNNITNNYISNGNNGIYLMDSDWNNITDNNISYNDYGLYLDMSSNNNIVANSIFSNNVYGIYLVGSVDNDIYHNNIIDNLNQAYDDSNESNLWNLTYPGGGNYWSDFSPTCPDLYSGAITPQTIGSPDGICDFQYDIDINSIDYYPLKRPWDQSNSAPSVTLNLTANGGVTFVNLTWDTPISDGGLPITHYRIYKGNISGGEIFYVEIGDMVYYNDTNVIGGNTYYYYVSAVNILGEGPLSNEDNATALAFPDAPFNLTSSSGDSYVNLTWEAPSYDGGFQLTNYVIYRGTASGGETFLIEIGNVTFYNDTTITNGNIYYYYISAKNVVGEGPFSNEVNATPGAIPDAPTDLNSTAGDSYVNITWTIPVSSGGFPITNYIIYRGTTSGVTTFLEEIGNVTYYNDTDVMNGVTYYYKVSARNVVGEGPLSNEADATPLGPPLDPQNLQASPGDSYVYLTWEVPAFDGGSPVTNYRIYRGPMSDAEIFLVEIGNLTSYNDANLDNGVIYFYKVKAVNSVGEGQFSNEANAIPAAIPGAPTDLSATSYDSYIRLTWITPTSTGGSPITNYIIYRGTTSGSLTFLTEIGVTLSYDDSTVSSGITYYYKVSAKNAVGEGPSSNEANAILLVTPSSPQNPQASAGDSYVNISWEIPAFNGGSSITNYIIYRGNTSGGETYLIEIGDVLYYNDTSINNGVTYYYKVSAKNAVGEGPLSDEVTALPIGSPEAPQNPQVIAGDSIVNITWNTPASDGGSPIIKYRIYRGTTSGGEAFLIEVDDISYYEDTGVTNGNSYYYRVSAVNAIGEGLLSIEVNAIPDKDSDDDGILDYEDDDDDNDEVLDENDAFPLDPAEWLDTDNDTIGNNADTDDDNDGLSDDSEIEKNTDPLNPDSDGDTHLDGEDAFPLDPNKWRKDEEQDITLIWILLLLIIIVVIIVLVMLMRKRGGKAKEMPAFEKELPPPPPGKIKETAPEGEETGLAEWEEEPKEEIEEEEKTVSEEEQAEKEIEGEEDILKSEDIEEKEIPEEEVEFEEESKEKDTPQPSEDTEEEKSP